MSEPNDILIQHVKRWMKADEQAKSLRTALANAEADLAAARVELGVVATPKDADCIDNFVFWIDGKAIGFPEGQYLLEVKRLHPTNSSPEYSVRWRQKNRTQTGENQQ
jgi:hypothetical protein